VGESDGVDEVGAVFDRMRHYTTMRRTLLTLTVAIGIAVGTVAPAVAGDATSSGAEPSSAPGSTSGVDLSGIIGSSDPIFTEGPLGSLFTDPDYTAFLVSALAAGAGAAGVTWAVQQRLIANPLPGIIPDPPVRHR
jgi:hypothetical protein